MASATHLPKEGFLQAKVVDHSPERLVLEQYRLDKSAFPVLVDL